MLESDSDLKELLPSECWNHVISYLPRLSRQSLAQLCSFRELIEDTTVFEDRRLYQALKKGNLKWCKVPVKNMQPRLRHGTINFNDQLIIFGGASGASGISGTYNDVWKFDFLKKFHRMTTNGSEVPSPRANFGFIRSGDKIFTIGGRSSNVDSFMAHNNPFEVHMLSPKTGAWQKVIVTGSEPQHSNGAKCIMLSSLELVTFTGMIPTTQNWMQEVHPDGNFEHIRTSMQVSILKFSDNSMSRGTWHRVADWFNNRRGMPTPRGEFHLASIGNDSILMIGGFCSNQVLQDAWMMKICRKPTYNIKWTQISIENPLVPSLPLNLFPSCLVNNLLVFTGVRTVMKKPGVEKPREEPKKQNQETSSSMKSSSYAQQEKKTPIYINLERPINTIGQMAAFSVSSQPAVPPQKVLKMQMAPEPPSPEPPPKRLQDYPMRLFCLDLSSIINKTDETFRTATTIRWLPLKNGGLFSNAPELRAHGTFTQFENGIALIGGVRRSTTDDDVLFTRATNEVYILEYVHDET